MKIVFWTEVFWPHIGGAEIFCFNLYKSLKARGHDLILITDLNIPSLKETADIEGFPIFRLPFREGLTGQIKQLAYAKRRLEAIFNEFQPDLIHLHTFGPASIFFVELQKKKKRPAMMTLHVHPSFSLKKGSDFLAYLENSLDGVSSVSKSVDVECQEYFQNPSLKKFCIVNAIPEPMVPQKNPEVEGESFILSLGRMVAEKGFKTALQAFAGLCDTFPTLQYVLAGDGPALKSLKEEANRLGISSRVEFRGWVAPQDTKPLMAASRLVLIPSEWEEPFGLVALEAAHLGKPVIATRSGGLPEIVVDGETGFLVEKQNPQAMTQAIIKLLQTPDGGKKLGQNAQRRAQMVFPFDPMVDQYEAAYQETLLSAHGRSN